MSTVNRRSSSSNRLRDFGTKNMSSFYFNPIVEMDLEEEIQKLQVEIMHLERSLLCRYRTAFQGQVASLIGTKAENSPVKHHRRSLADHLNASKPDSLSVQIVRCIGAIYCKFGTNPSRASSQSSASSSSSSSSSSSVLSSSDGSSSPDGLIHVLNIRLDDDHTFNYAATMLQKFRSLVRKLEKIDPRKMKQEEKLAFWINIHNALLMHAFLAYGSGKTSKKASVFKASYNIGGIHVNAYEIQSSILRIRPRNSSSSSLSSSSSSASSPRWIQTMFYGRSPTRHEYALEHPNPLVHFALAYGGYGDPPVRSYEASRIFGDLKLAKQEFVKSSVEIVGHNKHKDARVLAPRLLHYFVNDMSSNGNGIDIQELLKEELVNNVTSSSRFIQVQWQPQCYTFGYVIHPELAI